SKILNIGFNLHFHPGLKRLKEIIDQGILGTVLHAHARVGTYVTLVNSVSRHQANQEGALFLDYAHQPDLFYWLLKEKPVLVCTSAFQSGNLELSSNPNVAVINCEYKLPLVSSIHLNYVQMPMRHEYEIVGDKGWAVLDLMDGLLRIGTREELKVRTENFVVERDDMYRQEHQAFLDATEGIGKPETSADEGLVSMSVCEAIIKSWKKHEPVRVQL
ncbi:MAG: Gfo/Idh/MocA family oxidoreductase, partial [Kiritimatiellae bacterium]|nr:Gfo/Idh/MocA family oxidoreductase [Kiritimatiellia bacterium]